MQGTAMVHRQSRFWLATPGTGVPGLGGAECTAARCVVSDRTDTLIAATAELSVGVSRLPGAGELWLVQEARALAASIAHRRGLTADESIALLRTAEQIG